MKFEKVTDTKIKITLSLKDLELNNISAESIISNSINSQRLIENIISRAEKEIGFYPEDSKLLIKAIMPSNEKCIFTITKLLDDDSYQKRCGNSFIYKFNNFNDFTNLCSYLNNFSYLNLKDISKSFSLILYNGAYYLQSSHMDFLKILFNEFGRDVSNSTGIEGILNEYGKIIFTKNAILKCLHSFNT